MSNCLLISDWNCFKEKNSVYYLTNKICVTLPSACLDWKLFLPGICCSINESLKSYLEHRVSQNFVEYLCTSFLFELSHCHWRSLRLTASLKYPGHGLLERCQLSGNLISTGRWMFVNCPVIILHRPLVHDFDRVMIHVKSVSSTSSFHRLCFGLEFKERASERQKYVRSGMSSTVELLLSLRVSWSTILTVAISVT